MFDGATLEVDKVDLQNWDVSSALDMGYMFSSAKMDQDLSGWNINASNVNVLNTFRYTIGLSCDLQNKIATAWLVSDIRTMTMFTCSPTASPTSTPTSAPTPSPTSTPTPAPTQSPTNILQLIAIEEKSDNSAIVEITATFFGCMMVLIVSIIVVVYIFKRNKNDLYVDRKELCNDPAAPSVSQKVIF